MNSKMEYAVVELKYDVGKKLIVPISCILNFNPRYNQTDDFLCYWSDNLERPMNLECGYSQKFTGVPSLFKVFIVKLASSLEEAENFEQGKRVKSISKRFREPGNTDNEIKKLEVKKRRSAKKELKAYKAQAQAANIAYFIDDVELPLSSTTSNELHSSVIAQEQNVTIVKEIAKPLPEISAAEMQDQGVNMTHLNDEEQLHPPIPTTLNILHGPLTFTEERNTMSGEKVAEPETLWNDATQLLLLPLNSLYEDLVNDLMRDDDFNFQYDTSADEQREKNIQNVTQDIILPKISEPAVDTAFCNNEANIVTLNFDELINQNDDLKAEVNDLKAEITGLVSEVEGLKIDLENANKRNVLLQNYLVAANERVPEVLFTEKDGGRLYKGGVFLNKNQCLILDNSVNDREYLNNLTVAIFGREVLKTHSITGLPSNNTKGSAKQKLNEELLQLIYDIMDARSWHNKTKILTKSEKNSIIGKKISNISAYTPSGKNM